MYTEDDFSESGDPCSIVNNSECCSIDINCVKCEGTECIAWNHVIMDDDDYYNDDDDDEYY